jgi:hypothetical protein
MPFHAAADARHTRLPLRAMRRAILLLRHAIDILCCHFAAADSDAMPTA